MQLYRPISAKLRVKPLVFASMVLMSGISQGAIVTFTGSTSGGPTFNRLLEDLTDTSGVGTAVAYSTYLFTVNTSGAYSFLSTASFDNFTFLYLSPFQAASPKLNALAGNDDLLGPTTSGFTYNLTAGTQYAFVTTGFDNSSFGSFSNTIGGPGLIASVPEPSSAILAALGIVAVVGRRCTRRSHRVTS